MKKYFLLSIIAVVSISGCSTIHFDKGEKIQASRTTQDWHHNFIASLIEGSSVVIPKSKCVDSDWVSVKTEQSFVNGLAGGLVNTALFLPLWYPKTVEVSCK